MHGEGWEEAEKIPSRLHVQHGASAGLDLITVISRREPKSRAGSLTEPPRHPATLLFLKRIVALCLCWIYIEA